MVHVLQNVVFPLDRDPDLLPLYLDADTWSVIDEKPVRVSNRAHLSDVLGRPRLRIRPGRRTSFAAYFNAFPASYWQHWTSIRSVRLTVRTSGVCTVLVYRSNGSGATQRVDFAGGWLDVPRFSRPGEFIVNCAISPLVSLREWPYEHRAGLGGSGAWALINGKNGFDSEIELGVGWQDPAVIGETGLCVWRSGPKPELDFKQNGDFLTGRMAILWTGSQHDTPSFADLPRDYERIAQSGRIAREGVLTKDIHQIAAGVNLYHQTQLDEGMQKLPEIAGSIAHKYCGGGYGGYGLYLFEDAALRDAAVSSIEPLRSVEPFCRV